MGGDMRLRNKKTGEIGDILGIKLSAGIIWVNIEFHGREPKAYCYNSLAELNEEWEDYKPAEPLIEDEKIRKAVRAWADAEGIEEVAVLCHTVWEGKMTEIAKPDDVRLEITFRCDLGIKMGKYSISELCGEEEECES